MGMGAAAQLSIRRGGLSKAEAKRLSGLIAASGLPTRLSKTFKLGELLEAARLDKKARDGKLRFVLLKCIGKAFVSDAVTDADMREVVDVCR
jgi:3-dehydroquinate synthetase